MEAVPQDNKTVRNERQETLLQYWKGSACDPNHTSSLLKHGGGSVMAWAYIADSCTGSLICAADVTHDGSNKKRIQKSSETFCI